MEKLLWIDMEMTGLDVEKEVIIEVAAVVTDLDLVAGDTYHAILKQPQSYLDAMDSWNTKHHTESGLVAQVANGRDPNEVEAELAALVKKNWGTDRPILAGNSIGQDRLFINRYMKKLASLLHYRMLDVSSWKIIMNTKYGIRYNKENAHRAIDDIHESINELKLYLSKIKPD